MKEMKTDVLVVGYGFAGAVTAIVAHDRGAKVLLCEKMDHFGGCSILAGGGVLFVQEPEKGFDYFKALCGGRTPDSVIRAQADMMAQTVSFIEELCKVNGAAFAIRGRPGVYPLEGQMGVNSLTVRDVHGFQGYPWLTVGPGTHGPKLMKVLEDSIARRKIATLLSTPTKELLRNRNGEVTGAILEHEGKDHRVKARRLKYHI